MQQWQKKQGKLRRRSSQAMSRAVLIKNLKALVDRFCNGNISREILNILGRYWVLTSLQSSVGNGHILLGVPDERIDISLRIIANGMVNDLGQPMRRCLHCMSKKELTTEKTHLVASL
jgi:hypothetical protein